MNYILKRSGDYHSVVNALRERNLPRAFAEGYIRRFNAHSIISTGSLVGLFASYCITASMGVISAINYFKAVPNPDVPEAMFGALVVSAALTSIAVPSKLLFNRKRKNLENILSTHELNRKGRMKDLAGLGLNQKIVW